MINLEKIEEYETYEIDVQPSDKLFKELGNNTYNFIDLISEFIDNSISAKIENEMLNIEIEIGICESENSSSFITIRDNAKGIDKIVLGKALSPAEGLGNSKLNEHGLGMKQAISALGNLKYIATKTQHDIKTIIIEELKFGKINSKLVDIEWNHGTEICVVNLSQIVPKISIVYTKTVIKYLGARYRRELKTDNPKMKLHIKLLDVDEYGNVENVSNEWEVVEVKPIYFHPYKRKNEPILNKQKLKGLKWEAELTFGYAPSDEEYEDMEFQLPKNYEPYTVSLSKQGFDVIKNDRIINFHQLSELGLVSSKHSKYNYIRGEIDLKKGYVINLSDNVLSLEKGTKKTITVKISDDNVEIVNPIVTYSCDNTNIATVSANGEITSIEDGSCNIQVAYVGLDSITYTSTCKVSVTATPKPSIITYKVSSKIYGKEEMFEIHKYDTKTILADKYIDGVIVTNDQVYDITIINPNNHIISDNGQIKVSKYTNTSVNIQNKQLTSGSVSVKFVNKLSQEELVQEIKFIK